MRRRTTIAEREEKAIDWPVLTEFLNTKRKLLPIRTEFAGSAAVFFTHADTVCTHLDIVFGAGGYCPEVLIDGVNAGSNEWDGSGMEHLELVRSRPTRNGSETYYKTWTLIPKGSRE